MNGRIERIVIELRWPLILLALAILVGGAMLVTSRYLDQLKSAEYQQVQNRLRAAQLALNNVRTEEADLQAFRGPYGTLSARGVFGQEQRLNWVEYMNELAAKGRLQSLNYEVSAQRPVTVTASPSSSIEVLASRVQLKMGFVHEGDLVRTLEELRQSKVGFYRIDACSVKRHEGTAAASVGENLAADCRLEWITMRARSNVR